VGTFSQLRIVFTVECGSSHESLHSTFSSGAVNPIVGTISPLTTLRTP